MQAMELPTRRQIEYVQDLLRKLGYDLDDYDFGEMSKREVSKLIKELKAEYGG